MVSLYLTGQRSFDDINITNSELSTIYGSLRTYINLKKADCACCAEACDKYLTEAGETGTVNSAEETLRKAVNKVSGLFIPTCRIQLFQQTHSASAKLLADERDRKRGISPADEMLNGLNKQNEKLLVEDKRTKFIFPVDKYNHRTGTSHLWRIVKGQSGK